ncbi:MAG TPA: DNA double-strand break repair nuclease NurA [Anaerolineae bacterium]
MTLDFEKLSPDLEQMALSLSERYRQRRQRTATFRRTLERFADNWAAVQDALAQSAARADKKFYRSARPLDDVEPLNAAIPPPEAPTQATLIAADGSQIMPDRHAAFLYYLINVGGIIYHHGEDDPPEVFSNPKISYLDEMHLDEEFGLSSSQISIERDLEEIGMLAEMVWAYREGVRPLLGLVDQRLLYWPIGGGGAASGRAVDTWCRRMTEIRQCGGLLAGYIDRPGKVSVVTLLQALGADDKFDWKLLGKRESIQGMTDVYLFREILGPGQRSRVFLDVSPANERFAEVDPANQVCFFYLNPGHWGQQIARVDIPLWVAQDREAVATVHALVIEQCQITGDYPYALMRADEMAVVGHRDREELDFMIELTMQRHGVEGELTAKQGSKELARGGKTRHQGIG